MIAGTPAAEHALQLRGISKRFGAVLALDDVDFRLSRGSVHALLGENGAGKSTLMRVAFGMIAPEEGDVAVAGVPQPHLTVRRAIAAGVGMVHQHLSLAPSLSATENLELGGSGRYRPHAAAARLRDLSRATGLDVPAAERVSELSLVQQQRLEILKAIAHQARVLILDEPTALLAPAEARALVTWIRSFAANGGSVVLVTHNLREAVEAADAVTVLRRGRVTFTGRTADCTESSLARAVFPEGTAPSVSAVATEPGEPVVVAEHLVVRDARGVPSLRDASFTIRRNEIIGVAAIEGSGHRALLEALAGFRKPHEGLLRLPERVTLIPADRLREAIVGDFTLSENVALAGLGLRRGRMDWRSIESRTRELVEHFSISTPGAQAPARALSGGNQQRLVVARALEHAVDLVVADNPTRGLDLQAMGFVHEQLRRAAAGGAAVVVHSSDLDELLTLATRILVVFRGEVRNTRLDREAVGNGMLGIA